MSGPRPAFQTARIPLKAPHTPVSAAKVEKNITITQLFKEVAESFCTSSMDYLTIQTLKSWLAFLKIYLHLNFPALFAFLQVKSVSSDSTVFLGW